MTLHEFRQKYPDEAKEAFARLFFHTGFCDAIDNKDFSEAGMIAHYYLLEWSAEIAEIENSKRTSLDEDHRLDDPRHGQADSINRGEL